jgi:peptide deformylase
MMPILQVPHPDLRRQTAPITLFDKTIIKLADDMLETMYKEDGIGLAGPQVGALHRILVMDVAKEGEKSNPLQIINPEIIWRSDSLSRYNEGCLSLPEQFAEVERPAEVKVKYLTPRGEEKLLEATGLLATCVQHEIDHLHGVLFIDHISKVKRDMILRRLKKQQRAEAE